jgi:hypothetical protein
MTTGGFRMTTEVEYTDEFEDWWNGLDEAEQESVAALVELLEEHGPRLNFPHSSGIEGSRHGHMRELRIQHKGSPYRVLYAFDPKRNAILLIGGNKRGNDRWYLEYIPIADRLYGEHLAELAAENRKAPDG